MSLYLEAITALGKGSLHPGGFSHTLKTLKYFSISPDDIIIDIGCGTGRTACHLARQYGSHVFALDNSAEMLAQAKSRAEGERAEVQFMLADAADLPFRDEVADLIIMESVLIFLPVWKVLAECHRVLKKGGFMLSTELLTSTSLPGPARDRLMSICGLPQTHCFSEWTEHFANAGFTMVYSRQSGCPGLLDNLKELLYPDPYQKLPQKNINREQCYVLGQYRGLTLRNRRHLGFGTFILRKD